MRNLLFLLFLAIVIPAIASKNDEIKKEKAIKIIETKLNTSLSIESGIPQLIGEVEDIERLDSDKTKLINYRLRPEHYNPVFITLLRMGKTEGDLKVAKSLHRDRRYRKLVCRLDGYLNQVLFYEKEITLKIPDVDAYTLVPSRISEGGGTVDAQFIPTPIVTTYSINTEMPEYIDKLADYYLNHEKSCNYTDFS